MFGEWDKRVAPLVVGQPASHQQPAEGLLPNKWLVLHVAGRFGPGAVFYFKFYSGSFQLRFCAGVSNLQDFSLFHHAPVISPPPPSDLFDSANFWCKPAQV